MPQQPVQTASTPLVFRLLIWTQTLVALVVSVIFWRNLRPPERLEGRCHATTRTGRGDPLPFVSLLVPARNEAASIGQCVRALFQQDYPHFEVIVIDDGSTDATPQIIANLAAAYPQLRPLRLEGPPPGWLGKPHALDRGVQLARGSWLVFTDADAIHAPDSLSRLMQTALHENLDLVSLTFSDPLAGFWERCLMPVAWMGIFFQYPPRSVRDPRRKTVLAVGACIAIRRAVYHIIGGHERLRDEIVDDMGLARLVKGGGYKIAIFDGRELIKLAMYHGLHDIWEGWSKNVYFGTRGGKFVAPIFLTGLVYIWVVPFLSLLLGLFGRLGLRLARKAPPGWLNELLGHSAFQVSTILIPRLRINHYLRVPQWYALTHPLGSLFFTGLLGKAVWSAWTGKGIIWRGRSYSLDGKHLRAET